MFKKVWLGMGLSLCAGLVAMGCSSGSVDKDEVGTLALPLTTHGPSGVEYRLRNATFDISENYYYYDDYGAGGVGEGGYSYTVSSEDGVGAPSIELAVEKGYYNVRL